MPNVRIIPATKPLFNSPGLECSKKRRTAAYARVSTDSDEQYTSYEAQVNFYSKYIQERPDLEFVKVYADEGISGLGTKKRTGFNEMMMDALNGKIDLIITKSISRFARNTVDTLTAVRTLKDHGIEVWFEKENIQTFDGKGELLITIMSSLAQEESRSISENVTWGKRKAFENGKIYLPYAHFLGYKRGANDLPEIIPEQAEIVRKIYDLFISGLSIGGIAKKLTEENIPTPSGKEKWHNSTIESILTNEKYKGDAILQKAFTVDFLNKKRKKNEGEVPSYFIENSHPAIVSPEIFDRVQREFARRKQIGNAYSGNSIFSCRLVCGECGAFYGTKTWSSTSKYKRIVWQCNNKFKGEKKCTTPHLTDDRIKEAFMIAYNSLITDREQLLEDCRLMQKTLTDCSEIDKELSDIETELGTLEAMMVDCVKKNSSAEKGNDDYLNRFNRYSEKSTKLQEKRKELIAKKQNREYKAAAIGGFMFKLYENDCMLTDFDERLWIDSIDIVKVMPDGNLIFKFQNGSEVEVK